jgi:hypothetical protein
MGSGTRLSRWDCSDLPKDAEHIGQTVIFYNLPVNDPVKGRAHADDGLPGRGDPKKGLIVRTPKGEASGYFIALGHRLFQRPLDVRKTTAHHLDDLEVTRRTTWRHGHSRRYMKYGVRGDEFCGHGFAGGVDELGGESLNDTFIGFY